jgi:hypothetical protein
MNAASLTSADILKGERGGGGGFGGYGGANRGLASANRGGRNGLNFSLGGGGDDLSRMRGLDLKAYLPGGRQDPTRRLSGVNFAHPDIHRSDESLFVVISNRFQIHCKLQQLFDCR